jgi:predicted SAM-dependent methyltransferase
MSADLNRKQAQTGRRTFDEAAYLRVNPDVAVAVADGQFASGYDHYVVFGRAEGRPLGPVPGAGMSRIDKALHAIRRDGLGLEIGPSHNPMAPRKAGFNVHTLDHLDAEGLRRKYADHGVNVGNIEDVTFVWNGEPLHELVGGTAIYDWIIASHVIEHAPDFVDFLQECEKLLKPDGCLSLVIPDKRYCFDHFNRVSSTGDVLQAFAERRRMPGPGAVFDHFANASRKAGTIAWTHETAGEIELVHTFREAQGAWAEALSRARYLDVHCWRFVPDSFRLITEDLRMLGLTRLSPVCEYDTTGNEFFVTLGVGLERPQASRLEGLKRIRAAETLPE